jgi:hypothetical protein
MENRLKCDECDKTYAHKYALKYHKSTNHNGMKFPCNHCDRVFLSINGKLVHIKATHKKELDKCNDCGKLFKYRSNLISHARYRCKKNEEIKILPKKMVTCEACNKEVSAKYLNQHRRYYCEFTTFKELWKCPICDINIPKIIKAKHMRLKHPPKIADTSYQPEKIEVKMIE